MKNDRPPARLCVVGLAYFEVFLPDEVPEVPLGREVFVDHIDIGLGGALNPASVASALGVDTTLAHPRGKGPTDAAVAAEVAKLELGSHTWPAGDDPGISLVRSDRGDRSFISSADYDALSECPSLAGYDWIHVPGLEEACQLAEQLREARSGGATVSVAGSWAPHRLDELVGFDEPRWDVLLLNRDEARRAVGKELAMNATRTRLQAAARDVVITDGADDVHAVIDHEEINSPVPSVDEVVDATGAGDAFAAGYIASRMRGDGPAEALEHAGEVAATVVGIHGGVVEDESVFEGMT